MIEKNSTKVAIVVDPVFYKASLFKIAKEMHTWLIKSPLNIQHTEEFYLTLSNFDTDTNLLNDGISLFDPGPNQSDKIRILDEILDEVNEHHNEITNPPGWSELHIFGVSLEDKLEGILKDFEFLSFEIISSSHFIAKKLTR